MGRTRINRNCPDCDEPVSSTQIICVCGGSVQKQAYNTNGKKASKAQPASPALRKRPERTKRGKPNYYDALEFEQQAKKKRSSGRIPLPKSPPHLMTSVITKPPTPQRPQSPPTPLPHRMKLKTQTKKEEEIREEDLEPIILSEEKIAKFAVILDEINRKISSVSWRPGP